MGRRTAVHTPVFVLTHYERPSFTLSDTTFHFAASPVELGSGVPLRKTPDELLDRFHLDVAPSPSGVTHHLFWRK